MTTTTTTRSTTVAPKIFAVGGAATSIVLTAYGTFKEDNIPGDTAVWLFTNVPLILVATLLVFGLAVPRALRAEGPETPARAGLVLSLLALATIVIFFSGLPAVLAAAALCTAMAARRRAGRWTGAAGVAVALSVVTVVGAVLLAIVG